MFGEENDLAYVMGVVCNLSYNSLRYRMSFATDGDGARQVSILEWLKSGKDALPSGFPQLRDLGPGGRRRFKLGIPVAIRLFTVACQEIRPTRTHISRKVFHNNGDRIGLRIERLGELGFRHLRDGCFPKRFISAEFGEAGFETRRLVWHRRDYKPRQRCSCSFLLKFVGQKYASEDERSVST